MSCSHQWFANTDYSPCIFCGLPYGDWELIKNGQLTLFPYPNVDALGRA